MMIFAPVGLGVLVGIIVILSSSNLSILADIKYRKLSLLK